jgi:hypothetical protein
MWDNSGVQAIRGLLRRCAPRNDGALIGGIYTSLERFANLTSDLQRRVRGTIAPVVQKK